MEDALISPAGFMILSGAGLVEATSADTIKVHTTEQTDKVIVETDSEGNVSNVRIILDQKPYTGTGVHEDLIYVMRLESGEVASEPFIPDHESVTPVAYNTEGKEWDEVEEAAAEGYEIILYSAASQDGQRPERAKADDIGIFQEGDVVLVDYYVEKSSGAQQIEITPDKFGGNYYLEASTLFRDTNGVDLPAEFIIPNCKIQSNFTFTMASSGDPSTFTFTMDAFPDYTRFDKTKKVLAAIQIVDVANSEVVKARTMTNHDPDHEKYLM